MRDYDEDDPKKPRPVGDRKKGPSPTESAEDPRSWSHIRKDADRDRHRHV